MRKQYHFWPGEGGMDAWDVDHLIELVAQISTGNPGRGDARRQASDGAGRPGPS